MGKLCIPDGYKQNMTLRETQQAIKFIKDTFQVGFSKKLNLDRVTAPIIVTSKSGINDDLNGVERKVEFDIKEIDGKAEVVQSLAKWKRMALYRYGYEPGVNMEIKIVGLRPGEKLYEELLMKEEGMQETANKLIHIGKPIEMDDALLEQQLKRLGGARPAGSG